MQRKAPILICFCSLVLLTTGACSPVVSQHGNMIQDYQVETVKIGDSSRSDVLRVLGSPTTQSTFNPDVWYYIGQKAEKRGILDQEIMEERIVVVTFNDQGIVESIAPYEGGRQDIPYTRGKTPTHGSQLTFMQQLLGNLGRFNTGNMSATDY